MIPPLLALPALLVLPVLLADPVAASCEPRPAQEQSDEYETKLAEAGDDVEKLWALQAWCKEQGRNSDQRKVLQKIIELDENHEEARKALGHYTYDGRWFKTRTELSAYRRAEERAMAEKGLVRYRDEWIPREDAPFLRMGWKKDETSGSWMSPSRIEALAQAARYQSQGCQQQQQGVWIHPDEFEKWSEGLWKCGDEWLEVEAANAYHGQLSRPWRVLSESGRFVIVSPCPIESVRWAAWWADQTYPDLVDLFGVEPQGPLPVYVLDSIEQYNMVAAGRPDSGIPPTEGSSGWSACHYAYFADAYYGGDPPEFQGGGVCYYDYDDPGLKPFGQHAVRHAAALSYLDAIDPSWDTVSRVIEAATSGAGATGGADFWGEKRIPLWLRFGAASYVERYFEEPDAKDPQWARNWSISNLDGQLRPLGELFTFPLDPGNPDLSRRLLNEGGLVVSFIAKGGNEEVEKAQQALAAKIRAREETTAEVEALQAALLANEAAVRAYAGL